MIFIFRTEAQQCAAQEVSDYEEILKDLVSREAPSEDIAEARRDLKQAKAEAKHAATLARKGVRAYSTRVVKGVRLLNEKLGQGNWSRPSKLAISNLDLASGSKCVLGQLAAKSAITSAGYELYGADDYSGAVDALDINGTQYGFDTDTDLNEELGLEDTMDGFGILNHMWAEAIRMTRKGEPVTSAALVRSFKVV